MGGWMLEVGKMAMYVTFPVAMFHYFNQPEYFEKWVTQKKREIMPPEDLSHRKELEELIRTVRSAKDAEFKKALDDIEMKNKQSNISS